MRNRNCAQEGFAWRQEIQASPAADAPAQAWQLLYKETIIG